MNNAFVQLTEIRNATQAARARLNDKTIGTQVKAGKLQVMRVTYDAKGKSTITPVTDFIPFSDAIATLKAM
jgi:hypothetical protein